MPTLQPFPPPPNVQPISNTKVTYTNEKGEKKSAEVIEKTNETWAQWFLRLQAIINGTPVPPPFPGSGGANDLLTVNSSGTDFAYRSLLGTSNQITVVFGPSSITLSTPQDIAPGSSPTFANVTDTGLAVNSLVWSDSTKKLTSTAFSQAIHTFYAAPSGGAGAPTFRLIASSDLPSISLTGDATGSGSAGSIPVTFATVNANVGTFGDGTHVAQVTINGKGLVTAASNVLITGAAPTGAAGGDLSGTYPNPTVAKINGNPLGSTTPTSANVLIADGTNWITRELSGDLTISNTGAVTLASVVSASTNTKITYNAKGVVTAGAAAQLASADFANQGTTTTVLHGNAAGNPSFAAISLTADVSGTLPVANGGTGLATLTAHSLYVGNGTTAPTALGVATNGQLPIGSTGADPVLATLTAGSGISITNGAGSITIANTGSGGTVTSVALAAPAEFTVSGSPVTTSGTLTLTKANESANTVWAGPTTGAAAQPTFRSLVTADVSAIAVTNLLGTTNQVAVSAAVGTSTISLAGPHNFTTQTSHGLLLGQGTSAITALANATNGQLPIGSTGADPVLAALTAGAGISITNGAGSITITNTSAASNDNFFEAALVY